MKPRFLFIPLLLASAAMAAPPPPTLSPYSPSLFQDKKGYEWYIEQNGGLQRNGTQPTLIGNAMTLQIGNQQFYSQQPTATPDGKDIYMTSPQPMNGLSITRRITVMERDGGLRYVDQFTNTTNRDLTTSIEIRHNLNSPAKEFFSNTRRPLKDSLQAEESGIVLLPNTNEKNAPALLLTVRSSGSSVLPRISMRNGYQLSIFYNFAVPAGQSVFIIQAIGQAKLDTGNKPEDIAKAFLPFSMKRLTRDLPRTMLKLAVNMQTTGGGPGMEDWFPTKYWDITPESSDILAFDDASSVKGRAGTRRTALAGTFGKADIRWDDIAAMAGPGFTGTQQSWVWLRDGQRWKGNLDAPGLKFTLISGADLELTRLNRLVLSKPPEDKPSVPPTSALLETWLGERLAFEPSGNLDVATPWGPISVPWTEVTALLSPSAETLGSTLHLKDGTHVRVLPGPKPVTLSTRSFGPQTFDLAQVRQAITPLAAKEPADESEPLGSFLDIVGEQRLVARVTTPTLRLLTQNGPVKLAPANIRELSPASEDTGESESSINAKRLLKAELWGGGTIVGTLEEASIAVQGRSFAWDIPVRQLVRLVNPVPVTDATLMRRIGVLIQELGETQWKIRERASRDLKEMGILAKTSLQEALKQSTDAEVTRRLETLLSDME